MKAARDCAAQSEHSVREAAQRQSRTAAAMRRLEADVGRLSSQVTQLELTNRQAHSDFSLCAPALHFRQRAGVSGCLAAGPA